MWKDELGNWGIDDAFLLEIAENEFCDYADAECELSAFSEKYAFSDEY